MGYVAEDRRVKNIFVICDPNLERPGGPIYALTLVMLGEKSSCLIQAFLIVSRELGSAEPVTDLSVTDLSCHRFVVTDLLWNDLLGPQAFGQIEERIAGLLKLKKA